MRHRCRYPVDVISTAPKQSHDATLGTLFATFCWISSTAFGGAAIPAMRTEFVTNRGLLTEREFLDIYAIAQVSPGAVPVTLAMLIGRKLAGPAGFWVCLIAETVPGFVILLAIALLSMNPHFGLLRSALRGCAAAALGLLVATSIELTWPFRTKIVDMAVLVATAATVIIFHTSLLVMFVTFIPLSIVLQRLVKAE